MLILKGRIASRSSVVLAACDLVVGMSEIIGIVNARLPMIRFFAFIAIPFSSFCGLTFHTASYALYLRALIPRVVLVIDVLKAKRPNRGYLRDVLAGLCPVKVGGVTR